MIDKLCKNSGEFPEFFVDMKCYKKIITQDPNQLPKLYHSGNDHL